MPRQKKQPKSIQVVIKPSQEIESAVSELPPVSPTDFTESDESYQRRMKMQALEAESRAICGEKDPAKVNWRFKTLSGSESGTNMLFYIECKVHEINTGEPCNFVAPVGPVVTQALPRNSAGIQPLGSPVQADRTGNCKNC